MWLLLSPAMVEGSWLDLARRNKPEIQPFAHLTINATDIPSGKFRLHPAWTIFQESFVTPTEYSDLFLACYQNFESP